MTIPFFSPFLFHFINFFWNTFCCVFQPKAIAVVAISPLHFVESSRLFKQTFKRKIRRKTNSNCIWNYIIFWHSFTISSLLSFLLFFLFGLVTLIYFIKKHFDSFSAHFMVFLQSQTPQNLLFCHFMHLIWFEEIKVNIIK